MDNEKIKELAEQYAQEMYAASGRNPFTENIQSEIDNALSVMQWLSETHCIVEKEQIYMRHGVANALMKQDPAHREFYRGQSSVFELLFGKELLGKEEKE